MLNVVTACSGMIFDCHFSMSLEALIPCSEASTVVRNLRHCTDGPYPWGTMEQILDEVPAYARNFTNENEEPVGNVEGQNEEHCVEDKCEQMTLRDVPDDDRN